MCAQYETTRKKRLETLRGRGEAEKEAKTRETISSGCLEQSSASWWCGWCGKGVGADADVAAKIRRHDGHDAYRSFDAHPIPLSIPACCHRFGAFARTLSLISILISLPIHNGQPAA